MPRLAAGPIDTMRVGWRAEVLPGSRRIGVLINPDNQISLAVLEAMELGAKSLNVDLQPFEARRPDEYESAFSAMVKRCVDSIAAVDDSVMVSNAGSIVELATAQRIPSIGLLEIAKAGGLMAYGVDFVEMWRHAAAFVDKILKGAKPGDLPIEQPTKFLLVINLKTAKALGLTVPDSMLARADEVIE